MKKIKGLLIVLCVLCAIHVTAQNDEADKFKISAQATLSLNSPYHTSEGALMTVGKDTLLNLFRLDTSNAHMSNYGCIAKRFSYDAGKTWTPYTVVFHGQADDRNIAGSYKEGLVTVSFRELNQGYGYL